MTSNPAAAVRMLVIYSLCIPLAALVGWMLTDQLDYGTLGFFGLIAALLGSPLIIRYHYGLMVLGLSAPIYCFFLQGNPPLWQVVVLLSLGVAVIDRTLNSDKRFLSVPVMTWPMLFVVAVTLMTAELTGGIGLKALGGGTGGGKKYISILIGVATYFALTSRVIPKEKRKLFIGLFFLSGLPAFVGDLFPLLPSPLNYVNLLIPPTGVNGTDTEVSLGTTRLGAFSATASTIVTYLLVRHGLRGIFTINHPLRLLLFLVMFALTLLGGFRTVMISYIAIFTLLFFLERLYRTQMLLVVVFGLLVGAVVVVPFADKLPRTFQRAVSFIPGIKVDAEVAADAEGSKKWREDIWRDTWPKVPQYLLLGKGYGLSVEDFTMMGDGTFSNQHLIDNSENSLAISGDYHNGPLSTLMPFGVWGAIAYLWMAGASMFVLYRNFRYGDPELKTVNAYLLAACLYCIFGFCFVFGGYSDAPGFFARFAGFSIALNWCVCGPKKQMRVTQRINKTPLSQPQPA